MSKEHCSIQDRLDELSASIDDLAIVITGGDDTGLADDRLVILRELLSLTNELVEAYNE